MDSWINGSNIPGKPVTVMFYMGGMGEYMKHLDEAVTGDFEEFVLD